MQENLNNLYFSQSALNLFKICPVKFKRKYLEGLSQTDYSYDDSIKEDKQKLGRLFHLTAERYFCGIPTGIEDINEDNQLVAWMKALMDIIPIEEDKKYYPEYEIRLNGHIKLQAKYDLIVKKDGKYYIYDWKTEVKPMRIEKYRNSLQTILYCFLLVEAGQRIFGECISPQDVEMIYWQPSNPNKPLVLKYSEERYTKDKWLLENLVSTIIAFDFDNLEKRDLKSSFCKNCELEKICGYHGN